MKLTQITIENYRSCQKTTLDCHSNLTALIGRNAAGKTNILSAIYCLSRIFGEADLDYAYLKLTVKLSGIELPIAPSGEMTFHFTDFLAKYTLDTPIGKFFKSISYYSASAFSNSPAVTDTVMLKTAISSLEPRDKFLYNLVDTRFNNKDLFERYVSLVGSKGIGLVDDIEVTPVTDNSFIPLARVNGEALLFKQLSEGTFRTMALVYYLISNDGGLVLIEEPENSVHLRLLHDIVEIMQNESEHKQIIFSTHSDYVLGMLKSENVVFVDNGPQGTVARPLPDELSKGNYKGLKAYLENEGTLGDYWKEGGFDD
jgi:predicted ATPase